MSRRGLDAIVVGAGLVGAATALGLAKAGMRVAVIEAKVPASWSPEAAPDLRVFAISPSSSQLLLELGVWAEIKAARATPYQHMKVWDAAAPDQAVTFHAREVGLDSLGHIVEQSLMQSVLWRALSNEPNIQLHCPASISELDVGEDVVDVELSTGDHLTAKLLIAADGSKSEVRERLGIQTRGRDYASQGVVGFIKTELPHENTAWQRFQTTGPLAVLPFENDISSIVWTLPEAEAERVLGLDDTQFAWELERAMGSALGKMTPVSLRAGFPLHLKIAERYVSGRIVLIGDAAHGVHPLAGQGVNLGFNDVRELLSITKAAHSASQDIGLSLSLERYSRRRRSETVIAGYAFDGIERLFGTNAMLPTLLRGPALGLVNQIPLLKRFFIHHAAGK